MKWYIINLMLVVLILIGGTACKEEPVTPGTSGGISGQVIDGNSGLALGGVTITTTPPTSSLLTDAGGNFSIHDIGSGKYTIFATKSGYLKNSVSILVRDALETRAVIQLSKSNSNNAPNPPEYPYPANGALQQPTSLTLTWQASDPDGGDSLAYDILLYESSLSEPIRTVENHPDTSLTVDSLRYQHTYFWQVIARDSTGSRTHSEVWRFVTRDLPDNPLIFASRRSGNYEIYSFAINNDTTAANMVRLTEIGGRSWWPRMSPRRDKIAFVSNQDIQPQIYTMQRNGSAQFRVTMLPVAGFHNPGIGMSWSPDGTQLIYCHYEHLYRIDADRGNLSLLATAPPNRHFREVEWSPLGDRLLVLTIGSRIYDNEIYIMDKNGGSLSRLVGNRPGIMESPSFSQDGRSVMFTSDVDGMEVPEGRQLNASVFRFRIGAPDTLNVSHGKVPGTNDLQPRFSPDGARVVFINTSNAGFGSKDIWVMDADGRHRRKLVSDAEMVDWR